MAGDDAGRRGTRWGHSTARVLIWLGVFAVAFGYIEAAVAHYLRLHLYPDGFHDSIRLVANSHTVAVEAGRELCTLLVIAAVAALTPGPPVRRVANFVYVFAIWDLAYYGALWLFEGWPTSLFDWDLLFVLPVPWFGPVLAPIVISCIGIIGACSIHVILSRKKELIVPWHGFALVNGALMAWEVSFMLHDGPLDRLPTEYRWWLFLLGITLAAAGFALTWHQNPPSRVPERRRESVQLPGVGSAGGQPARPLEPGPRTPRIPDGWTDTDGPRRQPGDRLAPRLAALTHRCRDGRRRRDPGASPPRARRDHIPGRRPGAERTPRR